MALSSLPLVPPPSLAGNTSVRQTHVHTFPSFNAPADHFPSDDIQSYCDATDPYCSNGNNPATHNGYQQEYGAAALKFVKTKI